MAYQYKGFSSRFRFNGKEWDPETGNYYYGARYYDPKVSVWLSVDPKAYAFPSVTPYNAFLNNPIVMIDPGGDSTAYYDSHGNHLHTSHDRLENAVVVVNDENLSTFNQMLKDNKDFVDDPFVGDHINSDLRKLGTSYMVSEYFGFYDSNEGLVYSGSDIVPIDGQGSLIRETSSEIFNENGEMRIGGMQDCDGTPNMCELFRGGDAVLHTHPNDGRYVRMSNGRSGQLGGLGSDIVRSNHKLGTGMMDIVVRKGQVLLYNSRGIQIKHSRKNGFVK